MNRPAREPALTAEDRPAHALSSARSADRSSLSWTDEINEFRNPRGLAGRRADSELQSDDEVITEPVPLTVPGELGPDLTGPLDSEWMRLPEDDAASPGGHDAIDHRLTDTGLDGLDTQRLHPAPGPQAPAVSTSVMQLGGQIGRYTLEHRLGSGGLGTVWAAYDTVLARQVAIKTLPLHMSAADRDAIAERVLDEARAAARLSHPHIVTVHDAGIAGEGAYLAMELLRGKDLAELLRSGWHPTPEQAALIVRRVADALSYAHSKGVIHRDIKPANIFMVGRTRPVVLDFGIARLVHQADDPSPAVGSPYYAAPEQFDGKECDPRSDVYSLGVVLYELLCGARPFGGARLQDIRAAVRAGQALPPGRIRPEVPPALDALVMHAIDVDPARRPRSAGALARELRAWLAGSADAAEGAAAQTAAGSDRTAAASPSPEPVGAAAAPALRVPAATPTLSTATSDDGSRLGRLLMGLALAAAALFGAWLLWTLR